MAKMSSGCRVATFAIFLGLTTAAAASTIELEGNAGIGRSDNIARVPGAERSATIRAVGVRFSALKEGRRLAVDFVGDIALLDYAGSFYPAEVTGTAAGRLQLSLIEDRLTWVAEDQFGQTRQDLFNAPSPDNRENVNFFSTGPDLRLAMGSESSLLVGGRYTRVDYEHSPADSEQVGGRLTVERQLSGTARVSANVSAERIKPLGAVTAVSYDRRAAYARYAIAGKRTSFSINAGASQVNGSGGDDSGLLIDVELGRDVGGLSRVTFRAGHEVTDPGASRSLREERLMMPRPETVSVVQTSQPFTHEYVGADWRVTGQRTTIDISAEWSDERYLDSNTMDLRRVTFDTSIERALAARTSVRLGMNHNRYNFKTAGSLNEDTTYSAALTWSAGRWLAAEVVGEYYGYSSDQFPSTHEMRYWLRLRYGSRISR